MKAPSTIGVYTATAIVIANMIGAGIFTSLGFQLESVTNTWSLLILWSLGALMAFCGALSYAELGTFWQRSGGEYHFLSKAFHPLPGYLSGWVSLTVGFSAPVALSGMAVGEYVAPYMGIPGWLLTVVVILFISLMHSISLRRSSHLQNVTTLLKLLLIGILLYFGLTSEPVVSALSWDYNWQEEIVLPAFAVSFVFVSFSYSGWNAAAYLVEEIRDARRNLPRALLYGTGVVSVLYLLLNYVFLRHNSLASLQGQLEVGQLTAIALFGEIGGELISFGIGTLLLSGISAMVWAGPRITQVMGEDYKLWHWFSRKTPNHIPVRAIWLQTAITLALVLTGTFQQVLIYSGFVLQLFAALTVAAVFRVRRNQPAVTGFRSPFFPIPQLLFLVLSLWVLLYLLVAQPLESLIGLLNLAVGMLIYKMDRRKPIEYKQG